MTSGKSYNSIVFLTTLSVYFGLVLVGGTPPVLAHAAMTQHFDIQNEIEVKDDLDKKPDDCQHLKNKSAEKLRKFNFDSEFLFNYEQTLERLIKLGQQFSAKDFALQVRSDVYFNNLDVLDLSLNSNKPVLFPKDVRQSFYKETENLSRLFPKQHQTGETSFVFDFNQSKSKLETKTKFLQENNSAAQIAFAAYDSDLDFRRCETKNNHSNVIYNNTEIIAENNQIFIVTRLPRGSLDALLANKDAQ